MTKVNDSEELLIFIAVPSLLSISKIPFRSFTRFLMLTNPLHEFLDELLNPIPLSLICIVSHGGNFNF